MNGPKAAIAIAVTTVLIAALLLLACGQRKVSTGQGAVTHRQQMATSNLQPLQSAVSGELARLHRPRTWQSTKGFTPGEDYLPDQIAVKFFDELPQGLPNAGAGGQPSYNPSSVLYQNPEHAEYARSLANSYGLSVLSGQEAFVPGMNFCAYQIPSGEDAEELMQRILDENPQTVSYVEYVATRKAAYVPDDPGLSDQWHHSTIDSYGAWDYGTGSSEVIVAIIDTGVDQDHPDLIGNLINVQSQYPSEHFDLIDGDNVPDDEFGHGTHVAGLACAVGDNNRGVAGVAYGCSVLPVRVLDSSGDGSTATCAAGILLSSQVTPSANVINLSLRWVFPSRLEREACKFAYEKEILIVAAAGNENSTTQISFPAGVPYVMAVGATDEYDYKASFSNYGRWVDIAAPGTSIYSTTFDGGYDYMQGTSMASPIVAGAAALIMSIAPSYQLDEYRGWLEAGGDPVADPDEWQNDLIHRLNVYDALFYPEHELPTVQITAPIDDAFVSGSRQVGLEFTYSGSALYANLYVNGVLQDAPAELPFEVDFTNFYPGECTITVEVFDEYQQHAFDEITVIVTDTTTFPAPYVSSFDTAEDVDGWQQNSFSGENAWYLASDGNGGQLVRLDYIANDVDWLMTPNIDTGSYLTGKIVFQGSWDHTQGDASIWLYPDDPDLSNLLSLLDLMPINGFPGYYEQEITFEPGEAFKLAVMVGGSAKLQLDGTYIAIDDFFVTVPTNPPTVSITTPAAGQQVSGNAVTFSANATDDWSLLGTEFYAGGDFIDAIDTLPYRVTLDSTAFPNGSLLLEAVAYDWDWYDDDSDGNPWDLTVASRTVFVANQKITSLTPSTGYFGETIKVNGSGFNNHRPGSANTVTFTGTSGPIDATVALWSGNQIEVIVPEGCISGPVRVWIDGGYAQSPGNFTLTDPYSTFHFSSPNSNMMFVEDFSFSLPAQPDLDSVDVTVKDHLDKVVSFGPLVLNAPLEGTIDISHLTTGIYYLQAYGNYGGYSDMVELRFYLNTLPGDFDSSGEVDDGDAAYLRNYINSHVGEVTSNNAQFIPFLDTNGDGRINEQDLAYVGYWFGMRLE